MRARPLRVAVAATVLLSALAVLPALAQYDTFLVYVPIVVSPAPPPTPAPPDPKIGDTVIQLVDTPDGFTVQESRAVSNDQAAKANPDPKAAAKAFKEQSRQTSYYIVYTNNSRIFSGVYGFSDQSVRYKTLQGAIDGQYFAIQSALIDPKTPGYQDITDSFRRSSGISDVRALVRQERIDANTYTDYFVVVRNNRYIAIVHTLSLTRSSNKLSDTISFSKKALSRLPGY